MTDYAHRYADAVIADILGYTDSLRSHTVDQMAELIESVVGAIDSMEGEIELSDAYGAIGTKELEDLMAELTDMAVGFDSDAIGFVERPAKLVYDESGRFTAFSIGAVTGIAVVAASEGFLGVRPIDVAKDREWNRKRIASAVMSSLTSGSDGVIQRVSLVLDMDMRSVMRAARTAITGAENSGRLSAMRVARAFGIDLQKEWAAVMDNRTRASHRELDGTHVPLGEPFVTKSGARLMYPGDAGCGEPSEFYNCRCWLRPWVAGRGVQASDEEYVRSKGGA